MAFDLIIENGDKIMSPCVLDGVDVEWTRQGAAGKMTFTVLKDAGLSFVEGNTVKLFIDGEPIFYGFVIKKSRGKEHQIEVTCYDQLFYLAQNQGRYVAEDETASIGIRKIAKSIGVNFVEPEEGCDKFAESVPGDRVMNTSEGYDGSISETWINLPKKRIDSATSYLDIMQTLLDVHLVETSQMYVLYDDFGKLTLKHVDDMKFNANGEALLVSVDNAENFSYESSIENSYNSVTLYQQEKTEGTTEGEGKLFLAAELKDETNIKNWGALNFYEEIDQDTTKEDAKIRAKALLELHNQVKRKLNIDGVFCYPHIRGGSSVLVDLNLGDVVVRKWFMVESVTHHFKNDYSTMDLTVKSSKGFVL